MVNLLESRHVPVLLSLLGSSLMKIPQYQKEAQIVQFRDLASTGIIPSCGRTILVPRVRGK